MIDSPGAMLSIVISVLLELMAREKSREADKTFLLGYEDELLKVQCVQSGGRLSEVISQGLRNTGLILTLVTWGRSMPF